ncbi:MAG TPA: type II toxin-antitoxin system RelE/ParE family toxin [Candidatus Acidoferrales bacterium]|nr:type II toxin-antitoxin system RelE/ParE family toxin [Candidatus Acidoferrales bacterium]
MTRQSGEESRNDRLRADLDADKGHLSLNTFGSMILSFQRRGLKRLFERDDRSQIGADLLHPVEKILSTLDAADTPPALNLPGYRLHPLTGDRKGSWAVTVRAN